MEITNDTQQMKEGITIEGRVSLESQLPPRKLLLASACLSQGSYCERRRWGAWETER